MAGKILIFGATGAVGSSLAKLFSDGPIKCHLVAKNEEDVSATSNSNADNGCERGSLMDGRTRDENETGWIDLLNVTFSISRPNVASVVGRP